MDKKDKIFAFVVVLGLIAISVFYDRIRLHWEIIRWPALALLLILIALSKKDSKPAARINYAESRREFARHVGGYKWIKIYYTVYAALIVIGVFLSVFNKTSLIDFLIKGGLFVLIGGLLLPLFILGIRLSYEKRT